MLVNWMRIIHDLVFIRLDLRSTSLVILVATPMTNLTIIFVVMRISVIV